MHVSVLPTEVRDGLRLQSGQVIVDATVNGGGHASLIADQIGSAGTLIGLDLDTSALERSRVHLSDASCKVILEQANFRDVDRILAKHQIPGIDGILCDLGWNSDQIADAERGFSFMHDGPLRMTLADNPPAAATTAYDVVNTWQEGNLADIIHGFGEERYARRIARAIVAARQTGPIVTTGELVDVIRQAVPARYLHGPIHFATRTFQAIRIAVNDELGALQDMLETATPLINVDGRIAIISFHSLEDRIVKRFFKQQAADGILEIITKKPIVASDEERTENPALAVPNYVSHRN